MATLRTDRRLASILLANVVGYSRLLEQDEAGTLSALRSIRWEVIDPLLTEYHGRIFKLMGDGAVDEFGLVVHVVACAVEVQKSVVDRQTSIIPDRRIAFRLSINLGEVAVDGDDLLGDGVNVAARLEHLCEPGGILITSEPSLPALSALVHRHLVHWSRDHRSPGNA